MLVSDYISPFWPILRCLEEGAEEFLVKPVKLSDVMRLRDIILQGDENDEKKGSGTGKRKLQDLSPTSSLVRDLTPLKSASAAAQQSCLKRPRL